MVWWCVWCGGVCGAVVWWCGGGGGVCGVLGREGGEGEG